MTNPYNYYIYFPDAMQWVPPRWFNFVFQWAPSPLGTIRWDTTQDPYGNVQFQNKNQPATFICSNTLSDYTGGGAFNIPPNTQTYTTGLIQTSAVSGKNYLMAFNGNAEIPLTASVYYVGISLSYKIYNSNAAAANFYITASIGLTNGVLVTGNLIALGTVAQYLAASTNVTQVMPFVSLTLPVPTLATSYGLSSITGTVFTYDLQGNSGAVVDVVAAVSIIAG